MNLHTIFLTQKFLKKKVPYKLSKPPCRRIRLKFRVDMLLNSLFKPLCYFVFHKKYNFLQIVNDLNKKGTKKFIFLIPLKHLIDWFS